MTENELLISYIEDKIRQTEEQYRITSTGFLSPQEKSQAALCCRRNGARHIFCGGYPDAERAVLLLLPDYIENPELFVPEETDNPLFLLRCTAPQGARALTHRDYLGSLLALGIKRDVIGDILVGKGGADIIVLKSIAPFLAENYTKAGSVPLSCKAAAIGELAAPEPHIEEMRESVASVRLDNMLDAAFGISRTEAASAISHGLVYVNDIEASKPDARLAPGDKLVLRGHGKAVFREICGTTRKGRLSVLIERYI